MKNKILLGLMFLVLLSESALASAAPTPITFNNGVASFVSNISAGSTGINDIFSFTTPSQTASFNANLNVSNLSNVNINSFSLTDTTNPNAPVTITGTFSPVFAGQQSSFITLGANSVYDLSIIGTLTNTALAGSYSGALTLSPPVPEPSEYILMLLGFGLAGFVARRLKNDPSNMLMAV